MCVCVCVCVCGVAAVHGCVLCFSLDRSISQCMPENPAGHMQLGTSMGGPTGLPAVWNPVGIVVPWLASTGVHVPCPQFQPSQGSKS